MARLIDLVTLTSISKTPLATRRDKKVKKDKKERCMRATVPPYLKFDTSMSYSYSDVLQVSQITTNYSPLSSSHLSLYPSQNTPENNFIRLFSLRHNYAIFQMW